MFNAFLAQQNRIQEDLRRTAQEIQRRNDEIARKSREQAIANLKLLEQTSPKTVVLRPAPNQAAPPFPLLFR
jgi:hypothetical protein